MTSPATSHTSPLLSQSCTTAAGLTIAPGLPWLAPLAGYTDLPFRLLCRELGAAITCTEMVSAKGLIYGLQAKGAKAREAALSGTEALLQTLPQDTPLVVQLFGNEAAFLGPAVEELRARGYRYFDLNMGCSVPKVTKTGAGSAMLQDIPNALQVAKAMVQAAEPGSVGFKLRLGWRDGEQVFLALAKELEAMGAAWVTLHPRSAKQAFTGVAQWDALATLRTELRIPVIASGDLFTAQDAVHCVAQTGVNGVMFARGALANPAIFQQYTAALTTGAAPPAMQPKELETIIRRHATLAQLHSTGKPGRSGLSPALVKMRTAVPRYVKQLSGARALRQELTQCESWEAFEAIMQRFFRTTQLAGEAL
ncbi:tRNA dihydrouridine synthase [Desulfovibrio cuneatus]|uniref:tRNA dihydrouridine synthase n=1 Tax=Desulfovibrio cuneatus TaxID=159728 RepID=UPI000401DD1B|nr:tRNA-dihydrouridine synthase family protein [Desulfovibrio cuneatus]